MDYKNEFHSDDDFDSSNGYGDNNGNSGYSSGQTRGSNPNGLSKAELRKTNKPIMEKRRRARINHCLNELKSLILEAMKKDPARHTKLEKADILEMTVKHLQSVQRQQLNMAIQTDPSVIHKFKTGFVECADEVNRYINQLEGVDNGVRQRLTNHLTNCATSLEQIGSMTNFNNGYRGQLGGVGAIATANAGIFGNPLVTAATSQLTTPPAVIFPPLPQDLNNNSNSNPGSMPATPIQMGGMHLIPSRLPSGEFALIMPNTPQNATNATVNNILNGNHASGAAIPFIGTTWPTVPVPTAATVNKPTPEFSTNLQRNSAFSKPLQKISNNNTSSPYANNNTHKTQQHTTINAFHQSHHQNSTMTTSPPLSPISSVSSHGDDSIMHTSSDFNNTTSGRPVTPPKDVSHVAAVQHSFSGVFPTTPPTSAESSLNSSRISSASSSTHLQQQQVSSTSGSGETARVVGTTRKRSLTSSDGNDSSDSSEEPTSKKFITVDKLSAAAVAVADEERDSMWRPW